jgi:endonuclease VIII-like 1
MPELAEVKIMSDFINAIVAEDTFFEYIEKSPVSKVKTDLTVFNEGVFTMHAKSRGKELMLHMEQIGGSVDGAITHNLLCSMGMSGNWIYMKESSPSMESALKHSHLRLKTTQGNWLFLYDPRRFAKWRWVEDWTKNRGYCPLTEYNNFMGYIKSNTYSHKDFRKPLNELLMSQKWFNGVGNYLRAEILYRLDINPFQPANNLTTDELDELIKIVHLCVRDAYSLGGGQLKDWHNPYGTEGETFKEWVKCYGILNSVIDKTGRKFWYDPKWEEECKNAYNIEE